MKKVGMHIKKTNKWWVAK